MFAIANNVLTTLNASATDTATTLELVAASGINQNPPDPAGGTGKLTLQDSLTAPGKIEIVHYTGITGTGPYTLTGVTRGKEGTTAQSWAAGDYVYQAATADTLKMGVMNPTTVNDDLAIPANYNALLIGPISVASGKTVTVGSGSTLYIGSTITSG